MNKPPAKPVVLIVGVGPRLAKRNQEIRPFREIDDSFKKIVVTKDIVPTHYDENGILTVNIYEFLLNPGSIEG